MATKRIARGHAAPDLGFTALVAQWPDAAVAVLQRLDDPDQIQEWLNGIVSADWSQLRSPLSVVRDRRCNPLDAGLFAAAALRRLGLRPSVLPIRRGDDVWLAALFRQGSKLGVVGWHPDARLRFRRVAPAQVAVLAHSLAVDGVVAVMPLRSYNLAHFDGQDWMTDDSAAGRAAEVVLAALDRLP